MKGIKQKILLTTTKSFLVIVVGFSWSDWEAAVNLGYDRFTFGAWLWMALFSEVSFVTVMGYDIFIYEKQNLLVIIINTVPRLNE